MEEQQGYMSIITKIIQEIRAGHKGDVYAYLKNAQNDRRLVFKEVSRFLTENGEREWMKWMLEHFRADWDIEIESVVESIKTGHSGSVEYLVKHCAAAPSLGQLIDVATRHNVRRALHLLLPVIEIICPIDALLDENCDIITLRWWLDHAWKNNLPLDIHKLFVAAAERADVPRVKTLLHAMPNGYDPSEYHALDVRVIMQEVARDHPKPECPNLGPDAWDLIRQFMMPADSWWHAVRRGEIDTIKFLHRNNLMVEKATTRLMEHAGLHGHTLVVQYMHAHMHIKLTELFFEYICERSHLQMVRWAVEVKKIYFASGMNSAAARGNFAVVRYLVEMGHPIGDALGVAIVYRRLAVARYLLSMNAEVTPELFKKAAHMGVEYVELIFQHGHPLTRTEAIAIAKSGNCAVYRRFVEPRAGELHVEPVDIVEAAARADDRALLRYFGGFSTMLDRFIMHFVEHNIVHVMCAIVEVKPELALRVIIEADETWCARVLRRLARIDEGQAAFKKFLALGMWRKVECLVEYGFEYAPPGCKHDKFHITAQRPKKRRWADAVLFYAVMNGFADVEFLAARASSKALDFARYLVDCLGRDMPAGL